MQDNVFLKLENTQSPASEKENLVMYLKGQCQQNFKWDMSTGSQLDDRDLYKERLFFLYFVDYSKPEFPAEA